MFFSKIEPPYTSKSGCRLVWQGDDEDDTDTVILNKKELELLINILQAGKARTITLEDKYSTILVKADVTKFVLHNHQPLEAVTQNLQKEVLEYAKIPHKPQHFHNSAKQFSPSHWIKDKAGDARLKTNSDVSQSLLNTILSSSPSKTKKSLSESDIFRIFATRRSTRKFSTKKIEDWKLDKILAAADTAPTAGNFQGFKIFYVKNTEVKKALTEAANKQSYVNAPAVLVFCMDPARVKLKFPSTMLQKFSMQDATITAAYAQIAATGLGLSTIWIGMIDEKKVKSILGTKLRPSSILCIGYPDQKKPPRPRRKMRELIKVIE